MHFNRYLHKYIQEWLSERMVFVGGPRQVGKTYLAKTFINSPKAYLSWDNIADRASLKKHILPLDQKILVIDELHKYPRWRMLLKGIYDKDPHSNQFIITGSARLDHFRKGGDSLFGRYHYFRLHPFSLFEIDPQFRAESVQALLKFGGFPEPFLKQKDSFLKIWQRERISRVIHQDLRDISSLKDYTELELLADLLPSKVGSLLSLTSIAEDLEKSPHTIENWIQTLASVYHCYLVPPFGPPKIKAIKKQQKLYLWDWSAVEDIGPRFENMMASHLLKYCHFIEDTEGDKMELRFLRDQFGHEIDFVILKNKKPLFAVECKTGDKDLSSSIKYYKTRTNIPAFYQVHLKEKSYKKDGSIVLPFSEFCKDVLRV